LNTVREEAENSADPQQNGKTTKQLFTELNPLGRRLGRRQFIATITAQKLGRLRFSQTLADKTYTNILKHTSLGNIFHSCVYAQ